VYFIIIMMALTEVIEPSICINKAKHNKAKEVCEASEEDIWMLEHYRHAEGLSQGEKVYFVLEKIPFKNGNKEQMWLRSGEVQQSFMQMTKAAKTKGFKFGVNSAYRTIEHQRRLWREMPGVASNPSNTGKRSHLTGYAVDFSGTYAFVPFDKINPKWFSEKYAIPVEGGFRLPTRFYWWLKKNAYKYGFKNTVKNEPWHWKFVANEGGSILVTK